MGLRKKEKAIVIVTAVALFWSFASISTTSAQATDCAFDSSAASIGHAREFYDRQEFACALEELQILLADNSLDPRERCEAFLVQSAVYYDSLVDADPLELRDIVVEIAKAAFMAFPDWSGEFEIDEIGYQVMVAMARETAEKELQEEQKRRQQEDLSRPEIDAEPDRDTTVHASDAYRPDGLTSGHEATDRPLRERKGRGRWYLSPYLGYALGLGDEFEDLSFVWGTRLKTPTQSVGCIVHYIITDKTLIGLETTLQQYDVEQTFYGNDSADSKSYDNYRLQILLNFSYALSNLNTARYFSVVIGGGMSYGDYSDLGDRVLGFNAGVSYTWMATSRMGFFLSPRIQVYGDHWHGSLQVAAGVRVRFGG